MASATIQKTPHTHTSKPSTQIEQHRKCSRTSHDRCNTFSHATAIPFKPSQAKPTFTSLLHATRSAFSKNGKGNTG